MNIIEKSDLNDNGKYISFYDPYAEISDYTKYHDVLDKFIWLIKLYYSDKKTIKSKKYRLDILFQEFLKTLKINQIKRVIGKNYSKEKFIYYLKQGWYNELSVAYPFVDDPLNLGTTVYASKNSWKVDLFPSWFIIKSYYTVYSYFSSLVFTNSDNLKTIQHQKSTNHFNNTLLKKISLELNFYPFCLSFPMIVDVDQYRVNKFYWKYGYSKYPRNSSIDFFKLETDVVKELEKIKNETKSDSTNSIINIMFQFRVWANYIGNDTVVNLRSGGLLLFLERNLTALTFFCGGIAELIAISFLGEDEFKKHFMDFYKSFIEKKDELFSNWYKIPQINRLRIYEHMGLVNRTNGLVPPNDDPLKLI